MLYAIRDEIHPIWNTTAGSDSTPSEAGINMGTYFAVEPPLNLFDRVPYTTYSNRGICNFNDFNRTDCGLFTGIYFTLNDGPFVLAEFQMSTGNLHARECDPLLVTIEGSNHNELELHLGSSWTLIYDGDTGLLFVDSVAHLGDIQTLDNSTMPFQSFRFLFTFKRGKCNAVSLSEIRMFGFFY